MKKLVRNSMLVGAAVLGIGSLGAVAQAATTPATSVTSKATADITPGTITLDSAPGVNFGTVASSASDDTYTSTAISSDLHITDPGNASGYSVTVADSSFKAHGGGALKNAALSFADATAISADAKDNVSTAPTFKGSLAISDKPATVLNAKAGEGVGAYTADYGAGDASLEVPAGNIGGSYSSTLTWTLANAPA